MSTNDISAIRYAYMDLQALINAEDWAEIVELKQAAQESIDDLEQQFDFLTMESSDE